MREQTDGKDKQTKERINDSVSQSVSRGQLFSSDNRKRSVTNSSTTNNERTDAGGEQRTRTMQPDHRAVVTDAGLSTVTVAVSTLCLKMIILYLRWPAFASLDGKQSEHRRQNVVVTKLPLLPLPRLHYWRFLRVFVLEEITAVQHSQRAVKSVIT